MPRGGSKPGERRGGRKPGTPNKPKGERAVIALERAESEVRVLVLAGDKITSLGKDRLAELDQWAYGMAQKFAATEKEGKLVWENDGDELRFMRFMAFSAKCALGRAQFDFTHRRQEARIRPCPSCGHDICGRNARPRSCCASGHRGSS